MYVLPSENQWVKMVYCCPHCVIHSENLIVYIILVNLSLTFEVSPPSFQISTCLACCKLNNELHSSYFYTVLPRKVKILVILWVHSLAEKNLRIAQAATHANEHKLQEKAEDVGKQRNGFLPSFLLSEKNSPWRRKNIHISHYCVCNCLPPAHLTQVRSTRPQAFLHTSVWETVCSFQTQPCSTSKRNLPNFKLHIRQSED